jgi:hypothetical protein
MFMNRNSGKGDAAEPSAGAQPRSVEELLPESKPTRRNLEALAEEIRSGRYASSPSHRAEVLTKAGIMSTYLDMDENRPLSIKDLRRLLVEKGIYEEEHSFWGAKNLWIALQSMGFITKEGEEYFLSKDFAPLYRRWKQLREKHEAEMIENNAQHKRILADLEEKRARAVDATDSERRQARMARKEARQAAKEAQAEAYKRISEERAAIKAELDAKREAIRDEKRMEKLDKKLAALKNRDKL